MFKYQRAVCYSGYRLNQGPNIKIYPSYEEVKEDLLILERNFDIIRMYDPYEHAKTVLKVIRNENLKLKVMLGMDLVAEYNNPNCPWLKQNISIEQLKKNEKYNEQSLKKLIELANEYKDIIIFLSAGNEARPDWGDNLVSEDRIVYFINELKRNCPQPVSYCEGWDLWVGRMEKILAAVDFVCVHIYPLWQKICIKDAIQYTIDNLNKVINYTNKPVIITEMGWATSSTDSQMIIDEANIINQKYYISEMDKYLKENEKLGFFFEAFDEPWKGGSNQFEAEKNWGIYDLNRKKK